MYYKKNTGQKNEKGRNRDFFTIQQITHNLFADETEVLLNFYVTEAEMIDKEQEYNNRLILLPLCDNKSASQIKTDIVTKDKVKFSDSSLEVNNPLKGAEKK